MADSSGTEGAAELSGDSVTPDLPVEISKNLPEVADWLPEVVLPYWNTIAQYPIIGAIVIASVFYILAFVIRELLVRSIGRLVRNTSTELDNRVLDGLKKPVFNVVFLFGLTLGQ